ncbi:hypothetical protein A7D27_13605 [Pseudomonas sp. 1D4]|uniref:hypothetical protein n=1 Tax=Pseudomonadaceae TaxID=135621 RepID=UPI00084B7289|nr:MULTISPECIES: hypothetical protein [Pseudomonas]OEC41520.1 hypothetical protein A7D27_13605 [Pseudomonas sp. 1D4]
MESLGSLPPGWLLWLAGLVLAFWKWKWLFKPAKWLYTRLMPPKRFEVSYEALEGANAAFREMQSQDMRGHGIPLIHFYTVDISTHDSPISIKKVWVCTVSGEEFKAWRLGHEFKEPDEKVRIESQAIKSFHIQAPYNKQPDTVATIHVQYNGKVKIIHLLNLWGRFKLALGLG